MVLCVWFGGFGWRAVDLGWLCWFVVIGVWCGVCTLPVVLRVALWFWVFGGCLTCCLGYCGSLLC